MNWACTCGLFSVTFSVMRTWLTTRGFSKCSDWSKDPHSLSVWLASNYVYSISSYSSWYFCAKTSHYYLRQDSDTYYACYILATFSVTNSCFFCSWLAPSQFIIVTPAVRLKIHVPLFWLPSTLGGLLRGSSARRVRFSSVSSAPMKYDQMRSPASPYSSPTFSPKTSDSYSMTKYLAGSASRSKSRQ